MTGRPRKLHEHFVHTPEARPGGLRFSLTSQGWVVGSAPWPAVLPVRIFFFQGFPSDFPDKYRHPSPRSRPRTETPHSFLLASPYASTSGPGSGHIWPGCKAGYSSSAASDVVHSVTRTFATVPDVATHTRPENFTGVCEAANSRSCEYLHL